MITIKSNDNNDIVNSIISDFNTISSELDKYINKTSFTPQDRKNLSNIATKLSSVVGKETKAFPNGGIPQSIISQHSNVSKKYQSIVSQDKWDDPIPGEDEETYTLYDGKNWVYKEQMISQRIGKGILIVIAVYAIYKVIKWIYDYFQKKKANQKFKDKTKNLSESYIMDFLREDDERPWYEKAYQDMLIPFMEFMKTLFKGIWFIIRGVLKIISWVASKLSYYIDKFLKATASEEELAEKYQENVNKIKTLANSDTLRSKLRGIENTIPKLPRRTKVSESSIKKVIKEMVNIINVKYPHLSVNKRAHIMKDALKNYAEAVIQNQPQAIPQPGVAQPQQQQVPEQQPAQASNTAQLNSIYTLVTGDPSGIANPNGTMKPEAIKVLNSPKAKAIARTAASASGNTDITKGAAITDARKDVRNAYANRNKTARQMVADPRGNLGYLIQ